MHNYHKIVSPWKRTDSKSKTVNTEVFSDDYIEMLKDIQWIGTEKVDGENLNFYYDGNHVSYLGHTDRSEFSGEKKSWLDGMITPEFESIFEQIFGDKDRERPERGKTCETSFERVSSKSLILAA